MCVFLSRIHKNFQLKVIYTKNGIWIWKIVLGVHSMVTKHVSKEKLVVGENSHLPLINSLPRTLFLRQRFHRNFLYRSIFDFWESTSTIRILVRRLFLAFCWLVCVNGYRIVFILSLLRDYNFWFIKILVSL